ncbi:hypothetical protein JOL79_15700 [Microbispora sp. RL4-1S]|uniref:Uncharacterized protein n=1 Tax=Microbispora oryzae TaxID=2806554 RepID=A0A940WQI5_9ACTN|nr:hypothetical protein [Microbispora oryzae]MBP2705261.1 hypothetical protein [Microbispora oryzae]
MLAGILIGGGAVAVGGAVWHRLHPDDYGMSWDNRGPAVPGPYGGPFERRPGDARVGPPSS